MLNIRPNIDFDLISRSFSVDFSELVEQLLFQDTYGFYVFRFCAMGGVIYVFDLLCTLAVVLLTCRFCSTYFHDGCRW